MNLIKNTVDKFFSPKYLLFTNAGLGLTFLGLGDYAEQRLQKYSNSKKNGSVTEEWTFDKDRSVAMMKTGVIFGVAGHYWYKFLDDKFPGTKKSILIKKLAAETAAGIPFAGLTFITVGFFENKKFSKSLLNFKEVIPYICMVDWLFYVPLQSLNFIFLPPKFRFLYVSFLTFFYDTFLAHVLHMNDS